jgi:ATP-dependent Lhr-like helicase
VLERGELPTPGSGRLLHGSFPELATNDITALVEHLVEKQFLDRSEGVVQGRVRRPSACMRRGHYRDLLASFSGSMLLTGRHGASEVGYIDPTVLTGGERTNDGCSCWPAEAGVSPRSSGPSGSCGWSPPAEGKARWMGGAHAASLKSAQLNFSSEEIMLLAEAVKFSACVSADLLRRLVMARNYDLLAG